MTTMMLYQRRSTIIAACLILISACISLPPVSSFVVPQPVKTSSSSGNDNIGSSSSSSSSSSDGNIGIIQRPCTLLAAAASTSTSNNSGDVVDSDSTVVELVTPNNQRITIVGTAHLSLPSQEQVKEVITSKKPNVVLVELDSSRLPRIGIGSVDDIKVDRVVTAAEDAIPPDDDDDRGGLFSIFGWMQKTFLDGFSAFARRWLTSMYDGMKDRQKLIQKKSNSGEVIPGGEFLAAIKAAEECLECDTIILGDRSSVKTIQRAAQLAWKSGDALGVLKRLKDENEEAMEELKQKVRSEIGLDNDEEKDTKEEEARLEAAVIEALKKDEGVRDKMFERLEQKVPEFTQAFLKERDLIMSESIRRELIRPEVETVVAIVGLAHVPGIRENLQASFADGSSR